ncbi:MAG: hypothetical protein U9R74_12680 [Pseudomonadota bacterium]|nr:hypothetical protein [Pseudomonadota bacterium]
MKSRILTRSNMIIAGMALCVLLSVAHARQTKLVDPDPVTIGCNLSTEKMNEAIRRGGAKRGWQIVSQNPGDTELKYVKGNNKHTLWVNVSHTSNTFAVTYKDSDNLNYTVPSKDDIDDLDYVNDLDPKHAVTDGVPLIHPRPVGWMKNLSRDIKDATHALCFE